MPKRETSLRQKRLQRISYFGFVFDGLGILIMEMWQELKVTVKREGEELVSNLLIELGAQGVAIEDSMDYVGNVNRFGEIFPEVEQQEEIVVTAYYPETVDVAAVEADLQYRLAELTDFMDLGEVKIGTTALAEEDWADNWKKYYDQLALLMT